jgi:hypothetical protein
LERLNLKLQTQHWWVNHQWPDGSKTSASKGKIETMLAETVLMLRSYLQQYEMGYGYQNKVEERNWAAAVLRNAANIIEEIHEFSKLAPGTRAKSVIGGYRDPRSGRFVVCRADWFGQRLFAIRNTTSHQIEAHAMNWEILAEFLASLICYLTYGPEITFFNIPKSQITRPLNSEYDYDLGRLEILRKSSNNYETMFRKIMGS